MWIVALALRRPYTFVMAAILVLILGVVTIKRTPVDIFPVIDIPVITVIWSFNGISAQEMEGRIVTICERAYTTTVSNIEHMESQSMNGISVIKIYLQPGASVQTAIAQVTAMSQTIIRPLPPGITPPFILQYSATNVPVLQVAISSKTYSEDQLTDFANQFIRVQLATVQGAQTPSAFGGKPRNIMVDLDPKAMMSRNVSAADVSNAINAQNLILPAGTAKIGTREYNVRLNSSPTVVDALNDLPIKQVNGAMVYIRDVAHVRDGAGVQLNMVRQDGRRSALLSILTSGNASTLDVVDKVKEAMPRIQATLPPGLEVNFLFDQSLYVRASISGVLREAIIAACLTAAMILVFLGSWRSTLIVAVSIPLSILTSIIVMALMGETLNIMTLGGLALAVGILVDDATVEIENIHRNMAMGKGMEQSILDGAQQIAIPTFVSTLSICIVFVPVVFLTGAAKSLFTPLAMAVAFAMMASYLLTRTLVPTMAKYMLRSEIHLYQTHGEHGESHAAGGGIIWSISQAFDRLFERVRDKYRNALNWALHHSGIVLTVFVIFCGASFALYPLLGQDFFPRVDAGQFRLHVRAPSGTRLETTEEYFGKVEEVIRQEIPQEELGMVLDNIGIPSSVNLAFGDTATIGPSDGEILVALKENHHPTAEYMTALRDKLRTNFPELTFFYAPADIVNQILNFGLPSPIDIQVVGRDPQNYDIAQQIQKKVSAIPGAVDVRVHQVVDNPELEVNVDRSRAEQLGLSQRDVASDLLVSLSSSGQTAPNWWLNPQNGVSYSVQVQTPQYRIDSVDALQSTAVTAPGVKSPQLLGNLATVGRGTTMGVVNHYNVQRVFDVYANVENRDLHGVGGDVEKIISDMTPALPRGTTLVVRGQVETMKSSFNGLLSGLVFAAVLVYILIVVNFQSLLDPLIIMTGLPGALSGIIWMLYATHTTVSVPTLMGAIMTVGVATANSILMITFAAEQRALGKTSIEAALEAGFTRLRPVIMTAAAMIIGMLPMALGIGEGGEQNAPLGRAVVGGLLIGTFSTLFFVPVVYSLLHRKKVHATSPALDPNSGLDHTMA